MPVLAGLAEPPCRHYDVALLDLDGVVYIGANAVPGAPEALESVRAQGMRLAFVTNNAARPPTAVAELLTGLGVPAQPDEVITSSQAAAHHLARQLPPGARVLVIGTTGLIDAVTERGLTPVRSADDDPAAVVQGFSPTMDWPLLSEACVAIRRGLPWVATNLDLTVPSARGPVLGNGSLVAAVRAATGDEPTSTGKPDPRMHRESVERSHASRPLVVGDRLDTDIEGANRAECDSLLVLTGVTDADVLRRAAPGRRPTYVAGDLTGLLQAQPAVTADHDGHHCRSVTARVVGGVVQVSGASDDAAGRLDVLRAVCAATWAFADAGVDPTPPSVRGSDAASQDAIGAWALA